MINFKLVKSIDRTNGKNLDKYDLFDCFNIVYPFINPDGKATSRLQHEIDLSGNNVPKFQKLNKDY